MPRVLLLILSVISLNVSANSIKNISTEPFGVIGQENVAYTKFFLDDGSSWTNRAFISVGKDGGQRLYFSEIYSKSSYCTVYDKQVDNFGQTKNEAQIWKIDGQNVKMSVYCSKFTDSDDLYQTGFAMTHAGAQFIINRFKNSASTVNVKTKNGSSINFSAVGFTKAWNTAGGNAL